MIRVLTIVPLLVSLSVLSGSCILSSNVDDFEFELPEKSFHFDTGQVSPPAVTTIQCTASPDSCAAVSDDLHCNTSNLCEVTNPLVLPTIPCSSHADCTVLGENFSCETGVGACMATVSFELSNSVNLADEVPELETIGQSSFTSVHFKYIRMFVEENTFSVDTPLIEFYIAPPSVATLWVAGANGPELDPEVEKIGSVPVISASTSGHSVDVNLYEGGEAALTGYCRNPADPFQLFVYAEMTFHAGEPIPQGALTLKVDAAAIVSLN
ncbi:MAG: hypothetical protein ABI333_30765 [bacterium]